MLEVVTKMGLESFSSVSTVLLFSGASGVEGDLKAGSSVLPVFSSCSFGSGEGKGEAAVQAVLSN